MREAMGVRHKKITHTHNNAQNKAQSNDLI